MPLEDQLREAIVTGVFQPNEHLVEMDVSRMMGVSRSAVPARLRRCGRAPAAEDSR